MKFKTPLFVLMALAVALLAFPMFSSEAEAADPAENDVTMYLYYEGSRIGEVPNTDDPIPINAGEEADVSIRIENGSGEKRFVTMDITGVTAVDYRSEDLPTAVEIGPNESKTYDVTFFSDRYTKEGGDYLTIRLTIEGPGSNSPVYIAQDLHFTISSSLSSYGYYNKILGIIPNTLPSPLDSPQAAALITMALWALMAAIVGKAVVPVVLYIPTRGNREIRKMVAGSLFKLIFLAVVIFGIYESLKVLGSSEYVIDVSGRMAAISYVVLGALISWRAYVIALDHMFSKIGRDVKSGGVDETLVPLFKMIGQIIIVTLVVAAIFSLMGADLMGIIAGAGIAGLAISLGAQSMLRQFFSGITLLTTRPFKAGDIVRIDKSMELKVQEVGIMTTWFKNPWNEEIISMPNDKVAASEITNMTGENMFYRFNLFLEVTRDADLALAKKILVEAAMSRPQVIKDGTVTMPFARVTDITESGIKLRLAAFVYDYEDSWGVEAEIREQALKEFEENGIRMAYRKVDVRVRTEDTEGIEF
ncbi:MAG: mechanosensitive ion channel family protein [Candidatus Methanomethylophilaceae archaeon]